MRDNPRLELGEFLIFLTQNTAMVATLHISISPDVLYPQTTAMNLGQAHGLASRAPTLDL
jgi:hypothetical protein